MGRCRCLFVTHKEPASQEGTFVGDLPPPCWVQGSQASGEDAWAPRVGRHLMLFAPPRRGLTRLWMKEASSGRSETAGDQHSANVNY